MTSKHSSRLEEKTSKGLPVSSSHSTYTNMPTEPPLDRSERMSSQYKVPEAIPSSRRCEIGLLNVGNSCYQNAVIQCILHLDDFGSSLTHIRGLGRSSLARIIRDIFMKTIQANSRIIFELSELRELMGNSNKAWKSKHQQDAHEFLISLLDNLNDELKSRPRHNPVELYMTGKLLSRTSCSVCRTISKKEDLFTTLCLPVDSGCTLTSALASAYGHPELLTGENQFNCEVCRQRVDATRVLQVSNTPKILVFALKRFKWENGKAFKNCEYLDCPISWKITKDLTYSLVATVQHSGPGIHSGHYTAHVVDSSDQWYHCDDTRISEIKEDQVVDSDTYLLFYKSDN